MTNPLGEPLHAPNAMQVGLYMVRVVCIPHTKFLESYPIQKQLRQLSINSMRLGDALRQHVEKFHPGGSIAETVLDYSWDNFRGWGLIRCTIRNHLKWTAYIAVSDFLEEQSLAQLGKMDYAFRRPG
jgi:hypothetical protein